MPDFNTPEPPSRPASSTSIGRDEAAWRSTVVTLKALGISIDLTGAEDPAQRAFPVRSRLSLELGRPARGLWLDFQGEGVDSLVIDGNPERVEWDGSRIALPRLGAGEHDVVVNARGLYSNSGQGLHRFHDPVDGATYLYTHFEPSDARRAWPVMEQPDLKAPVSLAVAHPASWTVLANGLPEAAAEPGGAPGALGDWPLAALPAGAVVTRFAPTRPLPSYLTALAAGPWHRATGQWRSPEYPETGHVPLSWCCRASLAEHLDADELLALTRDGLGLFERAYGYPFPWGSYDSVLVPEYNLGAMENPGCVTFSEERYLFRGPATSAQRASRATTILHEMSHMWFGDLVTPRWWEDTWLKESFADHQGTWAASALGYDGAWVSFASTRKAWAYLEDQRAATTHPIVATVDDVEAARQVFDGISYAKGAAVLKQLAAYVGEEAFYAAAHDWFDSRAFANGALDDFLDTLGRASGRDMRPWAQAWLRTCGPSILTTEIETEDGAITRLAVKQACTDPLTGEPVIRPHSLVVGLYSFDSSGALTRTDRLPARLAEEITEIPGAVGLDAPDLVLVNDEDLTYTVVRPEAASLRVMLDSLSTLADPMARALAWSSLHNLLRDARLSATDFVTAVLAHADDATELGTLATLLSQASRAALTYAEGHERRALVGRLLGVPSGDGMADSGAPDAWERLERSRPGSGAQLVRLRAWLALAGNASVLAEDDEDGPAGGEGVEATVARLRSLLDAGLPGLEMTAELRWQALGALARLGALTGGDLEAQRRADPSASGRVHALQAASAAPTAEAKQEILTRLLEDPALSNDEVGALLKAYSTVAHRRLTAPLTGTYLDALERIWSERGQEIATLIVLGLFPAAGDDDDLSQVESWLVHHAGAPAALRRLVLKSEDDLARALRARRVVG